MVIDVLETGCYSVRCCIKLVVLATLLLHCHYLTLVKLFKFDRIKLVTGVLMFIMSFHDFTVTILI